VACKQHARKRDKSHTDIADKMKIFLREEQSADPRSDGLPDVKHGRIERDGRTRQIRRSRDEPRLLHGVDRSKSEGAQNAKPDGRNGRHPQRAARRCKEDARDGAR
jgi:hypothetical protein